MTDKRVYDTLQSLAGQTSDPRVQRLFAHFGCSHISTIMYRVWATDDPAERRRIEDAIARIVDEAEDATTDVRLRA